MAKNNQDKLNDIWWITSAPDGRPALMTMIADKVAEKVVGPIVQRVVDGVLNTRIKRGGAGATIGDGYTNLAALIAWNDDHTVQVLSAAAAAAGNNGADAETIKAAVVEALRENVVTVDVNVGGTK